MRRIEDDEWYKGGTRMCRRSEGRKVQWDERSEEERRVGCVRRKRGAVAEEEQGEGRIYMYVRYEKKGNVG